MVALAIVNPIEYVSDEKWEDYAIFTQRLKIPGGWLYRYGVRGHDGPMVFVPDAYNHQFPSNRSDPIREF